MDDRGARRLLFVHNTSADDIPPFMPMEMTGVEGTSEPIHTVQLPSEDSLSQIILNGPVILHAGDYEAITDGWPRWGVYGDTAPEIGDDVGAASGTGGLQTGMTGFTVLAVQETAGQVLVRPSGGGGGATFSIVQAFADGANGTVSTKAMTFKADLTASPNYDLSAGTTILSYFKA